MKFWRGYGSEHSANLVMIGRFKEAADASEAKAVIDQLIEGLSDHIDVGSDRERYSDEVRHLLRKVDCYTVSPSELEQFLYEVSIELKDGTLSLRTDEIDVSAFFKVMIDHGARVEIYSAHNYPDTPDLAAVD